MEKQEDTIWRWCIAGTAPHQGFLGECTKISLHGEDWSEVAGSGALGPDDMPTLDYVPGDPACGAMLRIERAVVVTMVSVPLVSGPAVRGATPDIQLTPANSIGLPFMLRHMPTVDVIPKWIIWLQFLHASDQQALLRYYSNLSTKTSGPMLPGFS